MLLKVFLVELCEYSFHCLMTRICSPVIMDFVRILSKLVILNGDYSSEAYFTVSIMSML